MDYPEYYFDVEKATEHLESVMGVEAVEYLCDYLDFNDAEIMTLSAKIKVHEAPVKLFARCSSSGTAASETCLCEKHLQDFRDDSSVKSDDSTLGDYRDCTGNEALKCQICGTR